MAKTQLAHISLRVPHDVVGAADSLIDYIEKYTEAGYMVGRTTRTDVLRAAVALGLNELSARKRDAERVAGRAFRDADVTREMSVRRT